MCRRDTYGATPMGLDTYGVARHLWGCPTPMGLPDTYGVAKTGNNHKVVTTSISRSSEQVVDIQFAEVLGELVVFNIYPGRFDGIFLRLAGSGPVVWHCGNEPPLGRKDALGYGDVIMAVLKPKHEGGREQ